MNTTETKRILLARYKKRVVIATVICSFIAILNVAGNIAILYFCGEEMGVKIGCIVFLIIALAIAIIIPFAFYKNYKNYANNVENRINKVNKFQDGNAHTYNTPKDDKNSNFDSVSSTPEEVANYINLQDNTFNTSNSFAKRKGLFKVILSSIIILLVLFIIFGFIASLDNEWLKDMIMTISIILILIAAFSFGLFRKLFHSNQALKLEKMFKDMDGYIYNNFHKSNMDQDAYIDKIPIIGKSNFSGDIFDQVIKESDDWIYTELKIEEKGYGKGGGISIKIFKGGVLEVPINWTTNFNMLLADINNKEIWPNGFVAIKTGNDNFDKFFKVFYEPIPGLTCDRVYHLLTKQILDVLTNIYKQTGGCSFIVSDKKIYVLISHLDLFNPRISQQQLTNNLKLLDAMALKIKKVFTVKNV